jgi:hypothetical protein
MTEPTRQPTIEEIEAARMKAPEAFSLGYGTGFRDGQVAQSSQMARLQAELELARKVLRHQETLRQNSSSGSMTGWVLNFLRRTPWYRAAVDSLLQSDDDPTAES